MKNPVWLTCALALLAAAGCTTRESDAANAPARAPGPARDTALLSARAVEVAGFRTATAVRAPWRDTWSGPARVMLDPEATQSLGAIAEGRVTRVNVMPGDRVRAGQVLVAIHSHEMMDARAALAGATAAAARAENGRQLAAAQGDRAERLYAAKALALSDLERARAARVDAAAARDAAAAELDRARAMVAHLVGSGPLPDGTDEHEVLVRAPIDGIVVARDAQPGQVVLVGAPLVAVSRLTTLALTIHLPEAALETAHPGQPVRFTVAGAPGRDFTAWVVRVAPVVDTLTRTVEVLARVPDAAPALRPEMFATGEILGPPQDSTLVVPSDAVQALEGDTVVVTTTPRGEGLLLEAVRVKVGRRDTHVAEIRAGLAPNATVVTTGAAVAKAEVLRQRAGREQP